MADDNQTNIEKADEVAGYVVGKYENKFISLFNTLLAMVIGFTLGMLGLTHFAWLIPVGGLIVFFMMIIFLDILFLEKYIFDENSFKKYWNIFGYQFSYGVLYRDLIFSGLNKVSFFYVIISFRSSYNKLTYFLLTLYSVGNCTQTFQNIKKALIKQQMIKGDENGWNC